MEKYSEKYLRNRTVICLLLAVEAILVSCLVKLKETEAMREQGEMPFYSATPKTETTRNPNPTPPPYDITPPKADVLTEYSVEVGKICEARDLVIEVYDECPFSFMKVVFETEPDWKTEGVYNTGILISDHAGNTTRCEAAVTVCKDLPTMTGLKPKETVAGKAIAYKTGVKAKDANGEELRVIVDNSRVKLNDAGSYYAIYTATDSEGRTITRKRIINVIEITDALVCEMAQKVLDEIIPEDCSEEDKIYLVWKWSHEHINYIGSSDKSDILHGAYEAFTAKEGDCFTFFCANMYMYRLLNIPAIECHRIPAPTKHFWSLVLFPDGYWYYVDSCPHPVNLKQQTYKMSEEDLKWFADKYLRDTGTKLYYTYDKDFYDYGRLNVAQELRDELKKLK